MVYFAIYFLHMIKIKIRQELQQDNLITFLTRILMTIMEQSITGLLTFLEEFSIKDRRNTSAFP